MRTSIATTVKAPTMVQQDHEELAIVSSVQARLQLLLPEEYKPADSSLEGVRWKEAIREAEVRLSFPQLICGPPCQDAQTLPPQEPALEGAFESFDYKHEEVGVMSS